MSDFPTIQRPRIPFIFILCCNDFEVHHLHCFCKRKTRKNYLRIPTMKNSAGRGGKFFGNKSCCMFIYCGQVYIVNRTVQLRFLSSCLPWFFLSCCNSNVSKLSLQRFGHTSRSERYVSRSTQLNLHSQIYMIHTHTLQATSHHIKITWLIKRLPINRNEKFMSPIQHICIAGRYKITFSHTRKFIFQKHSHLSSPSSPFIDLLAQTLAPSISIFRTIKIETSVLPRTLKKRVSSPLIHLVVFIYPMNPLRSRIESSPSCA